MLPQILTDFNAFVDGVGYVGRVQELQLPKVTKKTTEVFNGGMAAPAEVPVGYETLMGYITFSETPDDIVKLIAKNSANALNIRFLGTFFDPNSNSKKVDLEVVLTCIIKEMDPGTLKRGDQPTTKFEFTATYYKVSKDKTQLFEIDALKPFEA
jgi:Bacteriophage tail tube protein